MSDAFTGRTDQPFPDPRGDGSAPGALPRPLTSFIGRERELDQAVRLLLSSALLTLTGPGGSGKTRLCVELAARVTDDYPDGVFFVPLAPVADPGLVPSTIAQNVGLQDSRGRPLIEHLATHLRDKRLLMILDNFEHLLAAAPMVSELLAAAPDIRILVSSRSCLRVSGEQECQVPPLEAAESVRLFAERATAAVPGFAVTDLNAASIDQIARRLDGLPLAIELAAVRVKLLPPEAILPRLEHSLSLLTGGSRDLPGRQQTLRATISWSYDLLSDAAKRLLALCAAFHGGTSLELIEQVSEASTDLGVPVLDALAELVDQSLLRLAPQAGGTARYAMLETIREFAAERLDEMPEADAARAAHAAAFLAVAQASGAPPLAEPGERDWLPRLDLELDNIRAALGWYRRQCPQQALRLAAAMTGFWSLRGHFTEGRQRLRDLLEVVADRDGLRVRALAGAGWLAIDQGDYADAEARLAESIELSRELGDLVGEGIAAVHLGRCLAAASRAEEARPVLRDALTLLEAAGYRPGIAKALISSGYAAQFSGELEAASGLYARSAALCAELGLQALGARSLLLLGIARLDLGDLAGARAALADGLPAAIGVGDRFMIPQGLAGFAGLAARAGRPALALRLAGAAEAYAAVGQSVMTGPVRASLDRWLAPARSAAGPAAGRILAEGRAMGLHEAAAAALADQPDGARTTRDQRALTPREAEVAALVVQGLTSREIAARLYLSARTVDAHVDHILTKLELRNRTQLAAWASRDGVLPSSAAPPESAPRATGNR